MHSLRIIFFAFSLLGITFANAQVQIEEFGQTQDTVKYKPIDPLAPSKAAFYSAILPGLGQAYNKKYWKIPIVYGGLAVGYYFYNDNNNFYNEFRDIYKRRLEGYTDDKYYGIYSDNVLINAQRTYQRNRDISLMVMIGIYVLNIIDANVDAHLIQFNVNENLSLRPEININDITSKQNLGLVLNYKF
ncbi:DUF5683 domain-containing protein [Flavobacterium sp.]|uniref:DUF5683 domain-containing protein n=1 Tax=Flavobacterium sp. TaxID=239 RepID=UPI0037C04A3E